MCCHLWKLSQFSFGWLYVMCKRWLIVVYDVPDGAVFQVAAMVNGVA
jgi:hypothetical protein